LADFFREVQKLKKRVFGAIWSDKIPTFLIICTKIDATGLAESIMVELAKITD
jgi:hypothetical protein